MRLRDMYNKLEGVKEAINVYHAALDNREHGGVAQDKCIKSIESILGMSWPATQPVSGAVNCDNCEYVPPVDKN